ncbi:MAG: YceI family protein [Maricaulaceae bacterium]|nr:YceI family protein [Maricaulaceae bacterium]
MRFAVLAPLFAALALAACVSTPVTDPVRLPAGEWRLDPKHASVTWRARHLGLSWTTGRFDNVDATLRFDPANPQSAELTAIIDATSISTGQPDFDDTLRSAGWFDVERHPQIVFRSAEVFVNGDDIGRARGELTLKGVTREAEMRIEFYGGLFNLLEGRDTIGFGADLTVSRSDFGIGALVPPPFAGDDIQIRIEAEFLRERDRR